MPSVRSAVIDTICGLQRGDLTATGALPVRRAAHITVHLDARIDAFIALANTIIITRQLIRRAWTTHRWDTRPTRRP